MLRNYIHIAIRNFRRHKGPLLLNVIGITAAMTIVILILYYIRFETSFDSFHESADNLYRVEVDTYRDGALDSGSALSPPAVGKSLLDNFPEVEEFMRVAANPGKTIVRLAQGGKSIRVDKAYLADPSIFSMLTLPVVRGKTTGILKDPRTIAVSEHVAEMLWGSRWSKVHLPAAIDIYSQGLTGPFQVTSIYRDLPSNAHFRPQLLASQKFIGELVGDAAGDDNWDFKFFYTYVKLRPGSNVSILRDHFNRYVADIRKEALAAAASSMDFQFQRLTDIHLKSNNQFELESNGDLRMVYGMALIGVIVLVIAWINFVNLSTARGIRRAKEVGIRKVLGALRRQLITQFTTEAILINLACIALAALLVLLLRNAFSDLSAIPVTFLTFRNLFGNTSFTMLVFATMSLGILISAVYPSLILSHYHPIRALKKNLPRLGGLSIRQSLVVIQLVFSFIAIGSTIIVYRQITFMQSADLGFTLNQTVIVESPEDAKDTSEAAARAYRNDVLQLPFVKGFSVSSVVPGQEIGFRSYNLERDQTKTRINCGIIGIDADFIPNYGLTMVAGTAFSEVRNEPNNVIINEEAADQLGFSSPADAIGAVLNHDGQPGTERFVVIGVVKNYHQRSLRSRFEPILFRYGRGSEYFAIQLNAAENGQVNEQIRTLSAAYEKNFPGNPFIYSFLDAQLDSQYRGEARFGTIFLYGTMLAVVVSALGLLALSTFILSLRTSEIGIRKVFGASLQSLIVLLCRDYAKLLVIATLIGMPAIWVIASRWLDRYAFSIHINVMAFVIPVGILILIFFLTVGLQTLRTALRSPIDSIREE